MLPYTQPTSQLDERRVAIALLLQFLVTLTCLYCSSDMRRGEAPNCVLLPSIFGIAQAGGVDMTSPEPVERGFDVLESYLNRKCQNSGYSMVQRAGAGQGRTYPTTVASVVVSVRLRCLLKLGRSHHICHIRHIHQSPPLRLYDNASPDECNVADLFVMFRGHAEPQQKVKRTELPEARCPAFSEEIFFGLSRQLCVDVFALETALDAAAPTLQACYT
jgi:hypothetical protein